MEVLFRVCREARAFFTPVYFTHEKTSGLEKVYTCAEQLFDYGLGHYLIVQHLFRRNIPCVAKSSHGQSNYFLVALKVAMLLVALLYLPIYFFNLKTISLPFVQIVTVRSICGVALSVIFFMLECKSRLRDFFLPSYHVVDCSYDHLLEAKKIVEMGVTISHKMRIDVETIWFYNKKNFKKFYLDQKNVKWINKSVFTLKNYPNYIFKWAKHEGNFINILVSQAICLEKSLDKVVIPHSNYFHLQDGSVIIVQRSLALVQELDQIGNDQLQMAIKQGDECWAKMTSFRIKRHHHFTFDAKQGIKCALIFHDFNVDELPQPLFSMEEQLNMARGNDASPPALPSPIGESEAAEAVLQECLDQLSHALSKA